MPPDGAGDPHRQNGPPACAGGPFCGARGDAGSVDPDLHEAVLGAGAHYGDLRARLRDVDTGPAVGVGLLARCHVPVLGVVERRHGREPAVRSGDARVRIVQGDLVRGLPPEGGVVGLDPGTPALPVGAVGALVVGRLVGEDRVGVDRQDQAATGVGPDVVVAVLVVPVAHQQTVLVGQALGPVGTSRVTEVVRADL